MPGVLCLLAHPDDEIFCADLLSRLSRRGIPLHLACFTRGEGGRHVGDPPRTTRATLGRTRAQEMRYSALVLGARSLKFLNYVDRPFSGGHRAPQYDSDQLTADVEAVIEQHSPDLVLTHGSSGEYGHPAHRLLHEHVKRAVQRRSRARPALYSFSAYHPTSPEWNAINRWDWADIKIEASPYAKAKELILVSHETQWTAFVGKQDSIEDYRDAIVQHVRSLPAETYCCHSPGQRRVYPRDVVSWLRAEPDTGPTRLTEVLWDRLLKYKHLARITLGTGLLALRRRMRSLRE